MESKFKFCDVGRHSVPVLFHSRKKDRPSCCKNCYRPKIEAGQVFGRFRVLSVDNSGTGAYTATLRPAKKKQQSLPELLKLAEIVFNKWIRNRDKGNHGSFVCICCRKSHLNENMDAGHMFPKTYSALRFHEDNVWGQYNGCNRLEYGNVEEFKRNVKIMIGEERFNALEELKHVVKKWSREELLEIIKKYKL